MKATMAARIPQDMRASFLTYFILVIINWKGKLNVASHLLKFLVNINMDWRFV